MGMSENKTISTKVTPERKERLERFVQESENLVHLSDLIRISLNEYMSDSDSENTAKTNQQQQKLIEKIGDIERLLEEINSDIDSLDTRIQRIEQKDNPEINELANEIYPLLPEKEPHSYEWKKDKQYMEIEKDKRGKDVTEKDYLVHSGTVESIAKAFDASEFDVRKALDRLLSDMVSVRTKEHDGTTYYYKEQ